LRLARALASFGAGNMVPAAEALLGVDWKDLKVSGGSLRAKKEGEETLFLVRLSQSM
jgi:hypothetical protein